MNRRQWIQQNAVLASGAAAGGLLASATGSNASLQAADSAQAEPASVESGQPAPAQPAAPQPRYCLNTSSIAGHRGKTPLDQEIDLIAAAGYSGIEPWIREIQVYQQSGGKLSDLRKRLDDQGVRVEGAIGFANWIVDDTAKRAKGLETLRRDMDLVHQLGGTRIAAPPAGGTSDAINLDRVTERYIAALELGRQTGVTPLLELWGPSATLHRLGELMYVAVESGQPDAALLLDVYHMYRGGSRFEGLDLVDGASVQVLHMNDYPDIPREAIADKDRVFPGDGVAPVADVLRRLRKTGFQGVLSLELFNPTYWEQDVKVVLKRGLESMQQAVANSQASA